MATKGKAIMRAVVNNTMTLQRASTMLTDLSVSAEEEGRSADSDIKAWVLRPALRLYERQHGDWTDDEVRTAFAKWLEAP